MTCNRGSYTVENLTVWSIERKKKEGERERRKGGEEEKIIMEKIGGCTCRKNRHGKFIREHKFKERI